jgi:hypothetical protein
VSKIPGFDRRWRGSYFLLLYLLLSYTVFYRHTCRWPRGMKGTSNLSLSGVDRRMRVSVSYFMFHTYCLLICLLLCIQSACYFLTVYYLFVTPVDCYSSAVRHLAAYLPLGM